ncbi:NTPase KAP family P-loop domain-containing protein 1 isoform X2 [Antechinus flavipes]|uniref:NTPase KAP family P-loop domain-containing protein 1 isoform X2 n=1 Tax=Antechinus flavipes TaxID=38775 RepID=UPI002235B97F|nr:NTPase KAP family P-loop domain-containing protein 1 isoform X2 [Antechinus flavipes]
MARPYAAVGAAGTMPSVGQARFRLDRFVDPDSCQGKGFRPQRRQDGAAFRPPAMGSAHHAHRPHPGNARGWSPSFQAPRNGGYWLRQPGAAPMPPKQMPLRQRHCPGEDRVRGCPAGKGHETARDRPPPAATLPPSPRADTGPEVRVPSPARPFPALGACSAGSFSADIVTEDDVYCSCLSKTLCHVPTPVTVGFYAPFGCRLHMMLDKITALMQKEAAQREAEELQQVRWRPRQVHGWGFPRLLWYLVFYQPVITELHLRRKNVHFLFVRFSAWQYAGTDKLWAGLVTTLCDGIREHYGALPFSLYTVVGNKPAAAPDCCQREWHCRRRVCLVLLALAAALALGVGLLYLSLGGRAPGREGGGHGSLLKVFGGAATTLSGSGLLMALYSVGKHLFVSQRKKIERLVTREKFGSQLGFMCEVKKEVELLTNYLRFLEIFQRRRLRVVLEVTGLDTCSSERVVGVLDAINTLLSDGQAPFIFILVVDPHILASCLESASSMKGVADNGYLFLNRTVTLPFSVPIMGRRTKLRFLEDAVQSRDDLLYRAIGRQPRGGQKGEAPAAEGAELLQVEAAGGPEQGIEAEAGRRIREALFCLHDERDCLYEYVPDNVVSMRRIVNTVPITVRLLHEHQARGEGSGPTPRQAVAWVVLANQWPCRLSWALQCLEDRQQVEGGPDPQALLWGIFRDNSRELHTMTKALQNVVDLDGDPELFARFLGVDFPFTVAEAQSLLCCTVNLDHSIRRRMGLIRSIRALDPQGGDPRGSASHPEKPSSPHRDRPLHAGGIHALDPQGGDPRRSASHPEKPSSPHRDRPFHMGSKAGTIS